MNADIKSSEQAVYSGDMICGASFAFRFIKRAGDIFMSLAGLILLLPLMLVTALCVKLYDGGKVIYSQERLTKGGKSFMCYKFRSMCEDAESDGVARISMYGDTRVTPVGRIIRKYHIDELPQLINILKGEMSVVGPRPERPELAAQIEKDLPEFRQRLCVKAGLTGYAQVKGRYTTLPSEKLRMDMIYINNMSAGLDIKLILLTVVELFK